MSTTNASTAAPSTTTTASSTTSTTTTSAATTTPSTHPTASTSTRSTHPSAATTTTTTPSTHPSAPTTTSSTAPSAPTTAITPTTNTTNPPAPSTPSILRTSLPHAQARLAALSGEIQYAKTNFETTDAMRASVVQLLEEQLEQAVEEIGEVMMERVLRAQVVEDMREAFEEARVGWAVRSMRE